MRRFTRAVLPMLLACGGGIAGDEAAAYHQRVVREGIAVDVTIRPVEPGGALQAGQDVTVRFAVSDTTTAAPVTGAKPAAWIDQAAAGRSCGASVQRFLEGSVASRSELDLNGFYVLAMNEDATLSVVDPLFGYGGSKLLAMVRLPGQGLDWALTPDQARLLVSVPAANQVSIIDTTAWKVLANVDVGLRPGRVAVQPDGRYAWVGTDQGVTVVDPRTARVAARIPSGSGAHDIAFTADSRQAFLTNGGNATLAVIDAVKLTTTGTVAIAAGTHSLAFSPLGHVVYVASAGDGGVVAVDAASARVVARLQLGAGVAQVRVSPGGRLALFANPEKDLIQVLDVTTNRIVHTASIPDGPDQIVFSDTLAYIRRRASETVLMIPLDQLETGRVPAADFPGGQNPLGKTTSPSLADGLAEVPGAGAMLVANPADRAIYYYKEGMAAPMGSFSNYGHEPRAVLVVDRSLRERAAGQYETTVRLERPGAHQIAFLLDAPRVIECFDVAIQPNPAAAARQARDIRIEPLFGARGVNTAQPVQLRFRLSDALTRAPESGVSDVRLLAFRSPGVWQQRLPAKALGEGIYAAEFTPPEAGVYYVYVGSAQLGIPFNNPQYVVLEAQAASGTTPAGIKQ